MIIVCVADPGCLSCLSGIQIFIHLGSRIPDLGSRIHKQQQKRGVKKILFCSHKNHKIENYINFELVKTKILANFQRILELSTQKIVIKLLKISVGIRDPIPDPGVKKAPDPGSGSATLVCTVKMKMFNKHKE